MTAATAASRITDEIIETVLNIAYKWFLIDILFTDEVLNGAD